MGGEGGGFPVSISIHPTPSETFRKSPIRPRGSYLISGLTNGGLLTKSGQLQEFFFLLVIHQKDHIGMNYKIRCPRKRGGGGFLIFFLIDF